MEQLLTAKINLDIIKFIQSFHNPLLDKAAVIATMTAEEYFLVIMLAVIFWCINKKAGYIIGFAILSSNLLNTSIKELLQIPRPIGEPGIRVLHAETAPGYSFPSGHTQGAATLWTSIALQGKKKILCILGIIFTLLVGTSRIYLGVHRPIDVIGGLLFGVGWAALINQVFTYMEEKKNHKIIILFAIVIIAGMFRFQTEEYYKMAGVSLSFLLGFVAETTLIQFETKASFTGQCMKVTIGIAGILILKTGVKVLLPATLLSDFLRYLLIGIWVTTAAPWIFKKLIKAKSAANSSFKIK